MVTIKQNDFIELEYTGRVREDNSVFDTTDEKTALDAGFEKGNKYHPAVICVGEGMILKALDQKLIGKELGKHYTIEIASEEAFGRKNPSMIQLIPTNKFKQQNIQPVPGLHLNIDGVLGIIKTVSGGRCLVDFNHPLAGKDLVYSVKANKIIHDTKEKLKALLDAYMPVDADIEIKEDVANIKVKSEIPKEAQEEFRKIANRLVHLKGIEFTILQEKKTKTE